MFSYSRWEGGKEYEKVEVAKEAKRQGLLELKNMNFENLVV